MDENTESNSPQKKLKLKEEPLEEKPKKVKKKKKKEEEKTRISNQCFSFVVQIPHFRLIEIKMILQKNVVRYSVLKCIWTKTKIN